MKFAFEAGIVTALAQCGMDCSRETLAHFARLIGIRLEQRYARVALG
jgi:hypothetical protein